MILTIFSNRAAKILGPASSSKMRTTRMSSQTHTAKFMLAITLAKRMRVRDPRTIRWHSTYTQTNYSVDERGLVHNTGCRLTRTTNSGIMKNARLQQAGRYYGASLEEKEGVGCDSNSEECVSREWGIRVSRSWKDVFDMILRRCPISHATSGGLIDTISRTFSGTNFRDSISESPPAYLPPLRYPGGDLCTFLCYP